MLKQICDIHAHIVPGVDDGAINIEMSVAMLRKAYEQGVRNVICTSHDYGEMNRYYTRFNLLKEQLKKEKIEINLYSGCEIYCYYDIMDEIISDLDNEIIPTINETNYVLIEFDTHITVKEVAYCVNQLHAHGYNVIIAHVERYKNLFGQDEFLSLLKDAGCLFQINAYSLQDETNTLVKEFARNLLQKKYVTFIGSDAHRTNHRNYMVKNGINHILQNCDEKYANDICYNNAKYILNLY